MDRKAGENTSPERLSWSAANLGLASKPFLAGSMVQMWAKGNIEDPSFGSSRPRPVPNRLSRPVSDRGPSFCESRVKPSQSRGASRGRRVSSAETISQKKKKTFGIESRSLAAQGKSYWKGYSEKNRSGGFISKAKRRQIFGPRGAHRAFQSRHGTLCERSTNVRKLLSID